MSEFYQKKTDIKNQNQMNLEEIRNLEATKTLNYSLKKLLLFNLAHFEWQWYI